MIAAAARRDLVGLLAGLAGVLTIGSGLSASRQQPPAQPVFRTGVEMLAIDVAVLGRDDTPVEGLTPGDFIVSIDGTPRRIATFRFVRAGSIDVSAAQPPPGAPLAAAPVSSPPVPGRTVVIVVDREQIPAGGGRVFLEAAARFVDSLAPDDRVALWTLPVTSTATQYVADREQLKRQLVRQVGTRRPWDDCLLMSPDEAIATDALSDQRVFDDVFQRECTKLCACKVDAQSGSATGRTAVGGWRGWRPRWPAISRRA